MNTSNWRKLIKIEIDAGLKKEGACGIIEDQEVTLRIASVGKYQDSREYWKCNGDRISRKSLIKRLEYMETNGTEVQP